MSPVRCTEALSRRAWGESALTWGERALRRRAVVVMLATLGLVGCHRGGARSAEAASASAVGSSEDAATASGVKYLIPLRMIDMLGSERDPGTRYDLLLADVQALNAVFDAAGIAFYVRSFERHVMPNLNAVKDVGHSWSDVASEVRMVLPNAVFPATRVETERNWVRVVSAKYASDDEVLVWLGNGGSGYGTYPWEGRSVQMPKRGLTSHGMLLGHELGHFLGLPHTHAGGNPDCGGDFRAYDVFNPETGKNMEMSDYWDLVYCPGEPNRYFHSKQDAASFDCSGGLRAKNTVREAVRCDDGQSCAADAGTDEITCKIGSELTTSPSEGTFGLAFRDVTGRKGRNLMSYIPLSKPAEGMHSLSDSQIVQLRRSLRYDIAIHQKRGAGRTGARPMMAQQVDRALAYWLDFDGDKRRDVAAWEPPREALELGVLKLRLSSEGFVRERSISVGRLGEALVPADYDGDGRTDVAFFRAGGGELRKDGSDEQGVWSICSALDCSEKRTIAFGQRGDVPIAGHNLDANVATQELLLFRNDLVMAGNQRVPRASFLFRAASEGAQVKAVSIASEPNASPAPGLYDQRDELADLAVFNVRSSTYQFVDSANDWSGSVGSSQLGGERASGALLIPSLRWTTVMSGGRRTGLLSFAAWSQDTGVWSMLPTPTTGAMAPLSCTFGEHFDVPVPGGIDMDGDGVTDLLVRGGAKIGGWHDGSGAALRVKKNDGPACGGGVSSLSLGNVSPRALIFATADATGDGRDDLWVYEQETRAWSCLSSESGYTAIATRFSLGGWGAIPLLRG